jgi:hypothetical protein
MMERIGEASPRPEARITGAFYILTILTGIFLRAFVAGTDCRCLLLAHREFLSSKSLI